MEAVKVQVRLPEVGIWTIGEAEARNDVSRLAERGIWTVGL